MFNEINLEMSLKPFKETTPEYIEKVVEKLFSQWSAMLRGRERISIMLWVADGSEILDYTGDLDHAFEWAYFAGTANLPTVDDSCESRDVSLHAKNVKYMDEVPVVTYRVVKNIIDCIRKKGKKLYPDAVIRVGATFDIGPEFARSDFKYKRHPEICTGSGEGKNTFIDSNGILDKDDYPYKGFPDGIPQDTPFATFLGRQAKCFLDDLGYDYLWLSNGVGFSANPWSSEGEIFDGKDFHAEKFEGVKEKVFNFWRNFRKECPDYPVYTRGTNYSTGIDYAVDAVCLYDIYNAGFNIVPPPNSPWAAINENYGLELMGHLARNAELPGRDMMYRFYMHDPWWVNSPWYDRYNSSPHDIYLPMALSRINEEGKTQPANIFNVLSIDNTFGDMPDCCVNEVVTHILKAEKDSPDEAAPLVWVYPFREYSTTKDENKLKKIMDGDYFICDAIAKGVPVASVVSCDNFIKHNKGIYKKSILITPVPEKDTKFAEEIIKYAKDGGRVLFYGESDENLPENIKVCPMGEGKNNGEILLNTLKSFGFNILFDKVIHESKSPIIMINKNNNADIFTVYLPDRTVTTKLKFPLGAPILDSYDVQIDEGYAIYHFPKCEHKECRVYVEQAEGVVRVREMAPVSMAYRRRIEVSGLQNATVRIFAEKYCEDDFCVRANAFPDGYAGEEIKDGKIIKSDEYGTYYEVKNATGNIVFSMPVKKSK